MKTLQRKDIPEDFVYYRTASRVFLDFYKKFTKLKIIETGVGSQFMKAGRITRNFFSVIADRIDIEPSKEFLQSQGILHAFVFWSPMRIMEKPKGWLRMPTYFAKNSNHSSRTAFSILDREDYWNKWSSKARAHRRKVLQNIQNGKIIIERNVDPNDFLTLYKESNIPDPNKQYIIKWCEKKFHQSIENLRIYLIYVDGKALAGWIFIDEGVTSEYFTSFYSRDGYPYHLGIAMMDVWFLDSYEKWVKYCDLDHMRDSWQSLGYAWYTKFKESIADHDVYFHDMWVKIF
jgi:hypothetical protein